MKKVNNNNNSNNGSSDLLRHDGYNLIVDYEDFECSNYFYGMVERVGADGFMRNRKR